MQWSSGRWQLLHCYCVWTWFYQRKLYIRTCLSVIQPTLNDKAVCCCHYYSDHAEALRHIKKLTTGSFKGTVFGWRLKVRVVDEYSKLDEWGNRDLRSDKQFEWWVANLCVITPTLNCICEQLLKLLTQTLKWIRGDQISRPCMFIRRWMQWRCEEEEVPISSHTPISNKNCPIHSFISEWAGKAGILLGFCWLFPSVELQCYQHVCGALCWWLRWVGGDSRYLAVSHKHEMCCEGSKLRWGIGIYTW